MPESASCSFQSTEECAFHLWLRTHRLRHIHLRQEHRTFDPPLFRGNTTPPGFLVHLPSAGVVGVDAKPFLPTGSGTCRELSAEEIAESSNFELSSGIPVWYAFLPSGSEDNSWYWVRLQKVIDDDAEAKGTPKPVSRGHFVRVESERDLDKLYRLPVPTHP